MCSIRDRNFWKEFFSLYRHYPELWKIKSEAYKNRMLKRRAYAHLLDKFREYEPEATEDILKKKINNIRGCYRRELKKVNKSYQSDYGAEDQEEEETKDGHASLEIEANFMDSEAHDYSEDQEDPVGIDDMKKKIPTQSHATNRFNRDYCEEQEDSVDIVDCKRTVPTKPYARPEYSLPKSKRLATEKALEDLKSICKALNQPPEEQNEFDCFGASIACQLKKLPEKLAQQSMDYIQSFLVRQRLKSLENPCFELACNRKRKRSEGLDNFSQVDDQGKQLNADIFQIAKQMKEKEMEFIEAEHNEKVHILNLEKRNLENKLKYDEEEHILKMQQFSTFQKQ